MFALRAICTLLVLVASHVEAQSLERDAPDCAPEAIAKAQEGATRGEAPALYLMARYFSTGKCVAGDGPKARDHYWRAAELDYPPAFYNLGIIAAGGKQDFKEAELLFFRGAQLGHRGSELQLGILYHLSPAPVRDNVKSVAWLSVTAGRGESISEEARDMLQMFERKLSEDEKSRGKALSIQLREKFGNVRPFTF